MGDEAKPSRRSKTLHDGDVVAGKFRVERVIGEGGMALVFEATHLMLDERVALKCLRPEILSRADLVERFALESRAAAKLKSEHVARVIDVGDHDGVPYMVMEYLDGKNLEDILTKQGPLPIMEAVDLVIQACEGISEAHARGIVHRDVKPANLFLAERADGWPTLKILDFGISKAQVADDTGALVDFTSSRKVKTMSLLGSPYYMSPEQLRSTKDVDRRTDVWSLGVVLFELLTGKTPFQGEDFVGLAQKIFDEPHQSLTELRPDAPAGLEDLIDRALAKVPEDRFQSAGSLALALLEFTTDKRSRVIAAHAVTVTRSSGIEPDLPLPSGTPSSLGSSPHLVIPTPPSLPRIPPPSSKKQKSARPAERVTPEPKAVTNPALELAPVDDGRRSRAIGLAIGIAILVFLGIVLFVVSRDPPPPPLASAPSAKVEPSSSAKPERSTVAIAPSVTPSVTPSSEPNASASSHVGVAVPPTTHPTATAIVLAPKPSASVAPPPPSGEPLDIRRER